MRPRLKGRFTRFYVHRLSTSRRFSSSTGSTHRRTHFSEPSRERLHAIRSEISLSARRRDDVSSSPGRVRALLRGTLLESSLSDVGERPSSFDVLLASLSFGCLSTFSSHSLSISSTLVFSLLSRSLLFSCTMTMMMLLPPSPPPHRPHVRFLTINRLDGQRIARKESGIRSSDLAIKFAPGDRRGAHRPRKNASDSRGASSTRQILCCRSHAAGRRSSDGWQ